VDVKRMRSERAVRRATGSSTSL